MNKRKVCVVVASRANYGRVKSLMSAIQEHPALELQLIVGASTLLSRFGESIKIIKRDGFKPDRTLSYIVEGETLLTQSKSTGLGIIELSTAFEDLGPDIVITVADRFETMSTAIAASYLNITLVHIQGGEVSGNIDDRVRHAITKLSDFHFVATEASRERVIRMGETPERVFNYGCPSIDVLTMNDLKLNIDEIGQYGGVGPGIDWNKPYILMLQHPVTTSYGEGFDQVMSTLSALQDIDDIQKVILWPNIDAGSDMVSKGIRMFREKHMSEKIHYYKNFSPEHYAQVLNNAACVVGNSSSFIREGSFLGVPAVIVGDRQQNREHGSNVIFADYDEQDIVDKIRHQLNQHDRHRSNLFGIGNSGQMIADELTRIDLESLKLNSY